MSSTNDVLKATFLATARNISPKAGNMELQAADMFFGDVGRLLKQKYSGVTIRAASRVLVANSDPGGADITPDKTRNGLFVFLEADVIISRVTNAFGRVETLSYERADLDAEAITMHVKKKAAPGIRLVHRIGSPALSFALAEPTAFSNTNSARLVGLRNQYLDTWRTTANQEDVS